MTGEVTPSRGMWDDASRPAWEIAADAEVAAAAAAAATRAYRHVYRHAHGLVYGHVFGHVDRRAC